jgi:hypothetical protein
MKKISADKSYIDYTTGDEGIRVRKNWFRRIYQGSQGEWLAQDGQYKIRASEETLRWKFVPLPQGQAPPLTSQIAMLIGRYTQDENDPELEQVLLGIKTFEEAVSE